MTEISLPAGGLGAPAAAKGGPAVRHVAAVVAGNGLAFYDFLSYAFFAAQIGRSLFPAGGEGIALLESLATFGVGFLMRPVGALVIGRIADRRGRKPAMLLSFALMGVAMVGLALTPSYAMIGMAAPALAVLCRLLQGFAVGGELGASTAFMVEAAPPERRGFYVSLQYWGQDFAGMIAGLFGFILAANLSDAQLDAWGWRLAIGLGVLIVPFGLMLRRSLPETLDAVRHDEPPAAADPKAGFYIAGALLIGCGGVISYVMNYFTTYAAETLHMAKTAAFAATVVVGLAGVIFDPIGGWLTDRFGRKPIMIWPQAVLILVAVPAFMLIVQYRSVAVLLSAVAAMAITAALASSAALVAVTEAIPKRIRSGGLGLTYAISMCAFGGSTQFVVAWLTRVTHSPMAPAWYLTGAAVLVLGAVLTLPETAPGRRKG